MTIGLRCLVGDGYAKDGRAELAGGGASAAGDLYQAMLVDCAPGAVVEIVYPADADGVGQNCLRLIFSPGREIE